MDEKLKLNEKILIVDDDKSILNIIQKYLTKKGHNVIVASNGKEALDIMDYERITSIVSDLKMPEMDGETLVSNIRKRDKSVPVFIMTGFPEDDKINRLKSIGISGIFMKPLNLHKFEKEFNT